VTRGGDGGGGGGRWQGGDRLEPRIESEGISKIVEPFDLAIIRI
jgi:hypothetical protein